jgi:hypothetical protein
MHPELPMVTTDSTATARCYFDRPSAPDRISEEEAEEQARIFENLKALKQLAIDYMHPEVPVVTTDPTATARCYFDRASAPDRISEEEAEERARILDDVKRLKQLEMDYMHPELPVLTTDPAACARDYFTRASAPGHDEMIHTFPGHLGDDEHYHDHELHHYHEHLDHFGMDEDMDFMHQDMRQELDLDDVSLHSMPPTKDSVLDDEEGHLSRSPSSVMLIVGESIYD